MKNSIHSILSSNFNDKDVNLKGVRLISPLTFMNKFNLLLIFTVVMLKLIHSVIEKILIGSFLISFIIKEKRYFKSTESSF